MSTELLLFSETFFLKQKKDKQRLIGTIFSYKFIHKQEISNQRICSFQTTKLLLSSVATEKTFLQSRRAFY